VTTLVQSASVENAVGGTPTIVVDIGVAPAARDVVIIHGLWFAGGGAGTLNSVADNNGKAYTIPTNSPSTNDAVAGQIHCAYRICDGTEGDQIAFNYSTNFTVAALWAGHYNAGAGNTFSFDSDAKGTGTAPVTTPSITPSAANSLMQVASAFSSDGLPQGAWTQLAAQHFSCSAGYDLDVDAAQAANFAGTGTYTDHQICFKAAAGGGPSFRERSRRPAPFAPGIAR